MALMPNSNRSLLAHLVVLASLLFQNITVNAFRPQPLSRVSSRLFYTDDENNNPPQNSVANNNNNTTLTIPVLGPIPGRQPLLVGSEWTLQEPTPQQWQSIAETLHIHHDHATNNTSASIQAAPLIAVVDHYTTHARQAARYATIAAVVGLTENKESILLLGVGRAVLQDFFHHVPTDQRQTDEDGYLINSETGRPYGDDDNHYESNNNHNTIVMARFRVLLDTSPDSSPVHKLAACSALAFKLQTLHDDRRKLVAGIQGAVARLRQLHTEPPPDDWLLDDHDGIGALFQAKLNEYYTETMNDDSCGVQSAALWAKPHPTNYGMGTSASSRATLTAWTRVFLDKLTPYYSPTRCASEEHYYEVWSLVSLLALEVFLNERQMSWALQCTDTVARMEQLLEWMWIHVHQLKQHAELLAEDLRDCGAPSDDLW